MSGIVERETAKDMIVRYSPGAKRITVGADKGFDTADFVADMRDFNVTPHVAQNTTNRLSAIDHRTTRHCGYAISQQKRKRVEEPFGWSKTIGGLARPMLRSHEALAVLRAPRGVSNRRYESGTYPKLYRFSRVNAPPRPRCRRPCIFSTRPPLAPGFASNMGRMNMDRSA